MGDSSKKKGGIMRFRRKTNKRRDKRYFKKTSGKNKLNRRGAMKRGGIRL